MTEQDCVLSGIAEDDSNGFCMKQEQPAANLGSLPSDASSPEVVNAGHESSVPGSDASSRHESKGASPQSPVTADKESASSPKDEDEEGKHNKYCHFCQHVKLRSSAMLAARTAGALAASASTASSPSSATAPRTGGRTGGGRAPSAAGCAAAPSLAAAFARTGTARPTATADAAPRYPPRSSRAAPPAP
eukprot:CAMPEP_0172178994 /NCGR_PEP_ID=MMETSP1050-20130122/16358_1 /TAXON_ID=233186 /ORGANISM="Cryptomonas curvata, Strain CCAP979/52" /LENGTH=189 /DNA_ID=CAMNT_0012851801 /DNA_START=130 /DNA_END=697 /DNA_ORIENTATION=+